VRGEGDGREARKRPSVIDEDNVSPRLSPLPLALFIASAAAAAALLARRANKTSCCVAGAAG
jgi:hypothetical protein